MNNFQIIQIGCGVVGGSYLNVFHNRGYNIVGLDISTKIINKHKKNGLKCYNIN